MKKIGMLVIIASILASLTAPSVLACTTLTPGYWKTHPDDWPMSGTVYVGSAPYELGTSDEDYLMAILWDSPKGDAWIILAQKVIAAQLSMLKFPYDPWSNPGYFGGYEGGMVGLVDDANDWLDAETEYLPGHPDRDDVADLADWIDEYLNYWDEYGL